MLTVHRGRWREKPPASRALNGGHPLTQGLVNYALLADVNDGGDAEDLVGFAPSGAQDVAWSASGPAMSVAGLGYSAGLLNQPIVDIGDGQSFSVWAHVVAFTTPLSVIFSGKSTLSGTVSFQLYIHNVGPKLGFNVYNGTGTAFGGTGGTPLVDTPFTCGGTYSKELDAGATYLDGIQVAAFSGLTGTLASNCLEIRGGQDWDTNLPFNGVVVQLARWARDLGPEEMAWLADDPYAMLVPGLGVPSFSGQVPAAVVNYRRTLSPLGTRAGDRQVPVGGV